jgi:predicted nucleic acid-binding Zn ribbon protein
VSKHQKETAPVIVKHKHCAICQTPIPMSKDFCSAGCEEENKRIVRRRRYTFIATLAMFPVLLILLALLQAWRR